MAGHGGPSHLHGIPCRRRARGRDLAHARHCATRPARYDLACTEDHEMPADESLPGTLKRSPKKAQETWLKTHESAVEQYGEGERAHRTAFKSLKHTFEKVDD